MSRPSRNVDVDVSREVEGEMKATLAACSRRGSKSIDHMHAAVQVDRRSSKVCKKGIRGVIVISLFPLERLAERGMYEKYFGDVERGLAKSQRRGVAKSRRREAEKSKSVR